MAAMQYSPVANTNSSSFFFYYNNTTPLQQAKEEQDDELLLPPELLFFDPPPSLFDFDSDPFPLSDPSPLPSDFVAPHLSHQNSCYNSGFSSVDYGYGNGTSLYANGEVHIPAKLPNLDYNEHCASLCATTELQIPAKFPKLDYNFNFATPCDCPVVPELNPNPSEMWVPPPQPGGGADGKRVTAQSKAARERRRKIADKTVELGRLIPGGAKMNTAEMLQAGFKYVKFLQAQLGLLQLLKSANFDEQDPIDNETNLQNLPIVASQVVQEKLYKKDKCLIPTYCLPFFADFSDFETQL